MSEKLKAQLAVVRTIRRSARRQSHARSRLDCYRADIETLAASGARIYDIALWLRQYKGTKVHPSTVWRALMRAVKSRAFFEQMKGRGVRIMKADDL